MIKNHPGAALANSMVNFGSNVGGGGDDEGSGMTPIQQKVYKIIKSSQSKIGIHRDQISDQFSKTQLNDVQ